MYKMRCLQGGIKIAIKRYRASYRGTEPAIEVPAENTLFLRKLNLRLQLDLQLQLWNTSKLNMLKKKKKKHNYYGYTKTHELYNHNRIFVWVEF